MAPLEVAAEAETAVTTSPILREEMETQTQVAVVVVVTIQEHQIFRVEQAALVLSFSNTLTLSQSLTPAAV
jgi:hypothetical protein